jgi:hypothetical protein
MRLRFRLAHDHRWHSYPPAELEESVPDANVTVLAEVHDTVAALVGAARG